MWDLDRQSALVPLTRVALDPPATALGAGAGFTARTSLVIGAFEDTMHITVWCPPAGGGPGRAVVEKTGRALGGRIDVCLAPRAGGSMLTWRQSVLLPWLPGALQWMACLLAPALAPGYRLVLRRLLG